MTNEELQKLKDALEIGRDAAREIAWKFHDEYRGYREAEHKQMDKDVADIEEAIAIAESMLAAPAAVVTMSDSEIKLIAYGYRIGSEVAVKFARAILAAAAPAPQQEPLVKASAVPEGWKLVPVEPTGEMLRDGDIYMDGSSLLGEAWNAMLAATPSAPQAEEAPALPDWLKLEGDTITIHGIRYATELFANFADALPIGEQFSIVNREKDGAITICRTAPTSHVQLSIDTPEFRELIGKVYKRTSFSFRTPNTETEALIAHIDAKLIQAQDGAISMEVARDEAVLAEYAAIARVEAAEAQLAAIRAGLEGLRIFNMAKPIIGHQSHHVGRFVDLDSALTLFGPKPAPACEVCAGTKTAFGKRCECPDQRQQQAG